MHEEPTPTTIDEYAVLYTAYAYVRRENRQPTARLPVFVYVGSVQWRRSADSEAYQQSDGAYARMDVSMKRRTTHLQDGELRISRERETLERSDGARVVQKVGRQLEREGGREKCQLSHERLESERR